ncbi:hypothetical protein PDE_08848 [Penicillium oxalicum 114-2]|uniref:Acylphosphatase n=1 Tax=Penicillium oxalicum (strain 114-2 / CGMCC 5302) TaxID=933388 RepID=S7ZYM1_PENO1|nr:hypothetical protein PDE_08848 [Penicillium oxalicum 114-2]
MASKRIAFKVHGTVQGVGFRDFTQKCATKDKMSGWVRNTTCGRVPVLGHGTLALMENEYQVEGEVQGPEPSVQEFLKQIDKGPRHAHVVKLEKRELDVKEGDDQFVVLRTGESTFQSGA